MVCQFSYEERHRREGRTQDAHQIQDQGICQDDWEQGLPWDEIIALFLKFQALASNLIDFLCFERTLVKLEPLSLIDTSKSTFDEKNADLQSSKVSLLLMAIFYPWARKTLCSPQMNIIIGRACGDTKYQARKRFFMAKKPFNPRLNFIEMAQQEVTRCCSFGGESRCLWLCSAGINSIRVKFERNFYLTDEPMKVRCFVDNTRATTTCEKILVRLIRTIKCYGYITTQPQAQNQNRQLYPFEENVVIASQEFEVQLKPGEKQVDYSQQIRLFLDDRI